MLHTHVASPILAGRREEMAALTALLDAALQGRGSTAVIGGDAGLGKTRLCRELKDEAARRQVRVIEGRSSAAEMGVPYGPFMDALRFRIAKGEGDAAAQVLQPIIAHVAPLFTALGEAADNGLYQPEATARPFEPIFRVLSRLAALGPALFILEDIHWADTTSRDLLHYIARRVSGLPMLVVATYRTDDIHGGHPVHKLVASLARERAALRIQLEPLQQGDIESMLTAMLGAPPDPDFVTAMCDRTEGNPLFIEERVGGLVRSCPGRLTDLHSADLINATPPATLHEIIWERVSPLSDEAREALVVAAVIGRRFRFDVLAAALQWPEERLLPIIEELIDQRIVVENSEVPDENYAFRHSLMQEVLYSSTIGRRRRSWHRRVAAALETVRDTAELPHTMLAHHYSLGGDLQRARVHSTLAGDEAVRLCAWKDAEAMYEAALAALEREGGDPAAEADILERMADVAWWQNRIDAVEQYSSEALAIRRALGDRQRAAMLLRRLANLEAYQRGEMQRALRLLNEALTLLEDTESAERVFVLNDLGRLLLRHGDWEQAGYLCVQSLEISARRGDCAEEALSLVMLGWLAIHAGQIATGSSRLELARALLSEQPLPVERAAEVYHTGIRALEAAREHHRAREWVAAALAYAREHGAHADLAIYRAYHAAVQRRAGEWDAAIGVATEAVAALRASHRAELREGLRILGDLQRGRGELAAASTSYDEALALGESEAAIGRALLAMAQEQWHDAAERLAAALAVHTSSDLLFTMRVLPLLVEARARAGQLDAARSDLRRLRELMTGSDYQAGYAALAQAAGVLDSVAGDTAAAARELRVAVQAWTALELPYETAHATLLLATELVTSDGEANAVQLATEAATAFEGLGATLEIGRAHALLRRGGVRMRRRRLNQAPALPEPLDRLTNREAQVLFELARGCTNKQIARTLALSPRTVGNHVSAIFAKLGCATRTEAAQLAVAAR